MQLAIRPHAVLLLSHDAALRATIEPSLALHGYETQVYSDVPAAWDACQTNAFSLIILDDALDSADAVAGSRVASEQLIGADAGAVAICRALRALPASSHAWMAGCAILVIVDQATPQRIAASLAAGATDFLTKPLDALMIAARLALLARQAATSETLRAAETQFRSFVQHTSDIIAVLESDGVIRYVSPSVERILGYLPEDLVGAPITTWIHPDDAERALRTLTAIAGAVDNAPLLEFRMRHSQRSWRHVEVISSVLAVATEHDTSSPGIIVNARDITQQKLYEDQIGYHVFYDALTALPNRALFMDRLSHAMGRASRAKSMIAVLILDIDRFALVNETLGHSFGDQLLFAMGHRLQGCLRTIDTIGRLGGDEFMLLLEDIWSVTAASHVADRVAQALQAPFVLEGHELFATVSIGIACSSPSRSRPGDLLRDANVALSRAKHEGRAHAVIFDASMYTHTIENLDMEADLRRAIERGELEVYYQPEVDLISGQILGMEALARWHHPRHGLLLPMAFIPLAEESDLICTIGQWMLEEGCRQAHSWQQRYARLPVLTLPVPETFSTRLRRESHSEVSLLPVAEKSRGGPVIPLGIQISVNLSARQLYQRDLVSSVADILHRSGLAPSLLRLEITETVLIREREALTSLQALKDLGVRLAIDDFGTGHSSLNYLRRLPVDVVKIDHSFVSGSDTEESDLSIVHAVTSLAHTLGMEVTAEGIETEEQLQRMRNIRCDRGQGYFFSGPEERAVIDELLDRTAMPAMRGG